MTFESALSWSYRNGLNTVILDPFDCWKIIFGPTHNIGLIKKTWLKQILVQQLAITNFVLMSLSLDCLTISVQIPMSSIIFKMS